MIRIKSIGVLSLAKMVAAIQAAIGLLIMPFLLIIGIAGIAIGGGRHNPGGAIAGVVMAVLIPVVYACIGFVTGAIAGLVYNLVASWLGGIELELQAGPAAPLSSAAPVTPAPL